jgi:hypothetical protein
VNFINGFPSRYYRPQFGGDSFLNYKNLLVIFRFIALTGLYVNFKQAEARRNPFDFPSCGMPEPRQQMTASNYILMNAPQSFPGQNIFFAVIK